MRPLQRTKQGCALIGRKRLLINTFSGEFVRGLKL